MVQFSKTISAESTTLATLLDMVFGVAVPDIAKAVDSEARQIIIGIRPGEKIHEQMIGFEDAPHTFKYENHFKILPTIHNWSSDPKRIKGGKPVPEGFTYISDTNTEWMDVTELQKWISANRNKIGSI